MNIEAAQNSAAYTSERNPGQQRHQVYLFSGNLLSHSEHEVLQTVLEFDLKEKKDCTSVYPMCLHVDAGYYLLNCFLGTRLRVI